MKQSAGIAKSALGPLIPNNVAKCILVINALQEIDQRGRTDRPKSGCA